MRVSRRALLGAGLGLAGGAVLGTAGCADDPAGQTARVFRSDRPLPERFVVPLTTPPVKRPTARDGTATRYTVVQRPAQVEILPGVLTDVWGYDGLFPGPTLRARRGERVVVTHHNDLPVPTVVHLHGGHTPAASDGFPTDLVLPAGPAATSRTGHGGMPHGAGDVRRGTREHVYPGDQPAATLWYHDHRMDFTAPQVWRGLAGFHLVSDDVEDALPLPHGERDVPLMIMDRSFGADGELRYPSLDASLAGPPGVSADHTSGVLGDVLLVNGRPWPVLAVAAARYRLRLLNASNARRYDLALDPVPPQGPAFVQVASDGGLLAAPVAHDHVPLAPAERYEVLVDFGAYPVGTEVTLTNALGTGPTDAVMRFRVVRRAREDSTVPARLAAVPTLRPRRDAPRRTWRFARGRTGTGHWLINDALFDPARTDATVRLGDIEVWRFASDLHHPVHVHLAPFQVLSRGGRDPGAFDVGWKDTLDLRPGEHADVAVRFPAHPGRYLVHCHNLEHEDMGMMATFATVA
ncbi:spore coat protein A [Friedmanniella luteola]|uniref:Multicopper oxidase CueO n=1 Tax=Friedmanniella luteola TaxID=546871 RepID=A0A1H1QKV7_9ACTN|nr:multicopper oxidase family protein [Friedmanniella luteola]SDS23967.1 spore coat protein A [Friedmanniella luteola]